MNWIPNYYDSIPASMIRKITDPEIIKLGNLFEEDKEE